MTFKKWLKRATGFDRAVYWPPGSFGNYGKVISGDPIEIKCAWTDTRSDFVDREGVVRTTYSKIATLYPVEFGGILWHGKIDDVVDLINPLNNTGATEIRKISKNPNFKNTVVLYTVYA